MWLSSNEEYAWRCSVGQGSSVAVSCGIGHRCSLDSMWLWLWVAAIAPIGPLAWELPYARGASLKTRSKKQTNKLKCIVYHSAELYPHTTFIEPYVQAQ